MNIQHTQKWSIFEFGSNETETLTFTCSNSESSTHFNINMFYQMINTDILISDANNHIASTEKAVATSKDIGGTISFDASISTLSRVSQFAVQILLDVDVKIDGKLQTIQYDITNNIKSYDSDLDIYTLISTSKSNAQLSEIAENSTVQLDSIDNVRIHIKTVNIHRCKTTMLKLFVNTADPAITFTE